MGAPHLVTNPILETLDMQTMKLRGLPYYGTKAVNKPVGRWVAAQIPHDRYYVEPFAGMLGVLLQRKPSRIEIVNDLNSNVVNWWQVVRDKPDELTEWCANTPNSRQVFQTCKTLLTTSSDNVVRAGAFTHLMMFSYYNQGEYWQYPMLSDTSRQHLPNKIRALANRMRNVNLENRDALDVIADVVTHPDAVLYCDPPYQHTTKPPGRASDKLPDLDHDAMCQLLATAKCKVAVSGHDKSEYDLPGFNVTSIEVAVTTTTADTPKQRRTEMLWTNYPTDNKLF